MDYGNVKITQPALKVFEHLKSVEVGHSADRKRNEHTLQCGAAQFVTLAEFVIIRLTNHAVICMHDLSPEKGSLSHTHTQTQNKNKQTKN